MKAKKKFYDAIVLIGIVIVILLIGYLFYTPPLFDEGGYNIPGRIYNFFTYMYYVTLADWQESAGDARASRRTAARVAWYRPGRMEELLGIPHDDLFQLGQVYAELGLDEDACLLFQAALPMVLPNEEKSLNIISYLAILGKWPGTAKTAEELLEVCPESSAANYWYGRALLETGELATAIAFLEKSYKLDESLVDALYQIGRANEESGKVREALRLYSEVTISLPNHLAAWSALKRIYGERGEKKKAQYANLKCEELTPEIPCSVRFGNQLIFLGYNKLRREVSIEDELSLDIYFQNWRPRSVEIKPVVSFFSENIPYKVSRTGAKCFIKTNEEVIKQKLNLGKPVFSVPGHYIIESIDFMISGTECNIKKISNINKFRQSDMYVTPAWSQSQTREKLVREHFGDKASAVGKKAFLSTGLDLNLKIENPDKIKTLGLISFGRIDPTTYQGRVIAQIIVKTRETGEVLFPIRAGEETALCWWEVISPFRIKHKKAPIFRSWPIRQGDKRKAHEYYAIFHFNRPVTIESIRVKYDAPQGALYISDIILIPSDGDVD